MVIRRARDHDYAAIARLRRQTIRHVNAKDYPDAVIRAWAMKESARTLRAGAAGCTEVRLESTPSARDFYAAHGYKLIRKAAHGDDPDAPVYRMRKTLSRRRRAVAG